MFENPFPPQLTLLIMRLSLYSCSHGYQRCPSGCHWNGHCDTTRGHCTCYDGFYNTDCSGDCGCNGYGYCKQDHTCECENGWIWSSIERKCIWDCQCPNGIKCMGPGICDCDPKHPCKYGTCYNSQCECWEGYKGDTCSIYDPNIMANRNVNIGINLGGITYYSSEIKFTDIAKQSQSWLSERTEGAHSHEWDSHEESTVHWRNDGYPADLPPTMRLVKLMLRNFGVHAPRGNYTILYDGEGDIGIKLVKNHIYYKGKGRMVVYLEPGSGGVLVELLRTNPHNPLHNLRVIFPGYEYRYERFPFYPPFLESLVRYSEMRFMDFLRTNGHTPEPTTWDSRKSLTFHTQTGSNGAAIEHMIHLANIIGSDPWFNMPHAADDNYVTQFATLVKKTLRPDLKVYIEYSNEVWNGIFRQTKYSQERGISLNLDSQSWRAGFKYYNKRSTEVMKLWKKVYGSAHDKLIPVWAWQTGYQDYTRQALEDLGSRSQEFKALAITGYFGCDKLAAKHAAELPTMSFQQMAQLCKDDMPNIEASYRHYMELAKNHSLKLLMYEGGPGIVEAGAIAHGSHQQSVTEKAIAFNRHGMMEVAVTDVLEAWRNVTSISYNSPPGGLFNYFSSAGTPSKYGSWGMLEYTGQPLSSVPKYRAVHKFMAKYDGHDYVAPKCSFVKMSASTFAGCFIQNDQSKCGTTDISHPRWTTYVNLCVTGSICVADGYNPKTRNLYIRAVDEMAGSTYFIIDSAHSDHMTK
ncbi:hypothetical protein FSP39_012374 [Pinctada imbricata]|uniref:EGF-like domain-containing protein n=1 Tax=Pinctada imbricata TaxID=66713 RepID=A0AA88XD82_PINIB|nr:hypothetical protein FSP39_012374 [Pinctada imbricata]